MATVEAITSVVMTAPTIAHFMVNHVNHLMVLTNRLHDGSALQQAWINTKHAFRSSRAAFNDILTLHGGVDQEVNESFF